MYLGPTGQNRQEWSKGPEAKRLKERKRGAHRDSRSNRQGRLEEQLARRRISHASGSNKKQAEEAKGTGAARAPGKGAR